LRVHQLVSRGVLPLLCAGAVAVIDLNCGRQLSTDNRILDERLKAARPNVRFGLVSGQLSKKRLPEGAAIPFLISCCLSAASIRFLGLLFLPRNSRSLHPPTTGGTFNDTAGVA
jgi:hypothetical protein